MAQLAAVYRVQNGQQALPDSEIYFMLLKNRQVEEVTALIQSLKKTPGLKKLGTSMEHLLSGDWIKKNLLLETSPETMFSTLHLQQAGAKLDETPLFYQWLKYVDMYQSKKGDHWFGELDMLDLIRKTMPEENVVTLLHLLRQTPRMKDHADTMQRIMFDVSKCSHQFMINVWLKSQVQPEEVYKILRLDAVILTGSKPTAKVVLWFRYTKAFGEKTSDHGVQTIKFLQNERVLLSDYDFATIFQTLKDIPDLKKQAEGMPLYLFRQWANKDLDPKVVARNLADPGYIKVISLPKNDPKYVTWKAYTLFFAELKGGDAMLRKVTSAFAKEDPQGALAAAMKN